MRDPIMGNSCYSVVVTVLLVVGTKRTRALQDPCDRCEPGTFCKQSNLVCTPCPSSTYSSSRGQRSCETCRVCDDFFRFKKLCSPSSNAECECVKGFHCSGPECHMCEKDCELGQESTEQGCKNCAFGTFNNQTGGKCRPWTNCSLGGKSMRKNGTREEDVVCGPTLVSVSPEGHSLQVILLFLALTSAMLLFLISLILWLSVTKWSRKKFSYIFKQPFKMASIRTAQEEDACSCRFPEEEEGGGSEL